MTPEETMRWFDEIHASRRRVSKQHQRHYAVEPAERWLTDAQSALESVFPANHAVLRRWHALRDEHRSNMAFEDAFDAAAAIFDSAHAQLATGRLRKIVDGIRAESVAEVLDQGESLLGSRHVVAAAVLAGGALESHLKHLCERHQLAISQAGSISKYNGAVGAARNAGNEIYSANDGKLVEAWGGVRNDAAHSPGTFSTPDVEVRIMIAGIRSFIARHP